MASSAFVHIKWFAEEYSVQTARGAGRRDKPYEYFCFLLDEITEHLYGREHDPNDRVFLNDLLPQSDKLPDICKKKIWGLLEPDLAPALFLLDGCGWAVT